MNEKKPKKKSKKVATKLVKIDTSILKKVDVVTDIPVEEQFDFSIQGAAPITIGISGENVSTTKLKRITILKTPLKPGQTYVPKKKRKPSLNTKTIRQSNRNYF